MSTKCKVCDDTKHVYDSEGVITRCPHCFKHLAPKIEGLPEDLTNLKIPEGTDHNNIRARQILLTLLLKAETGNQRQKAVPFLYGAFASAAAIATANTISGRTSMKGMYISFSRMQEFYFQEKMKTFYPICEASIVILTLGTEMATSASPTILREFLHERKLGRRFTLACTPEHPDFFKTTGYPSDLKKLLFSKQFTSPIQVESDLWQK